MKNRLTIILLLVCSSVFAQVGTVINGKTVQIGDKTGAVKVQINGLPTTNKSGTLDTLAGLQDIRMAVGDPTSIDVVPLTNLTSLTYTITPARAKKFGSPDVYNLNYNVLVNGKPIVPYVEYRPGSPGSLYFEFGGAITGTLNVFPGVGHAAQNNTGPDLIPKSFSDRVVYQKNYFNSLSDFNITGLAPTLSNGEIHFSGSNADFSKYLELKGLANNDENYTIEAVLRVAALDNSSFGFAIGKKSINSYDISSAGSFSPLGFIDNWQPPFIGTDPRHQVKYYNGTFAAGDVVKLTRIQQGNKLVTRVENLTNTAKDQLYLESVLGPGNTISLPNTSNFALWEFGGNYDLLSLKITSQTPPNVDIMCVGDSKTQGQNAMQPQLRFASGLTKLGSVAVYAGGADKTSEVLAALPYINSTTKAKYIPLCIGRNDLAAGIPAATWQANYSGIVSGFQSTGAKLVHVLPIPEPNLDQTPLRNWIIATYGIQNCVDVSPVWNNATMVDPADGIHENTLGSRIISDAIIASGLIPLNNAAQPAKTYIDPFFGSKNASFRKLDAATNITQNDATIWFTPVAPFFQFLPSLKKGTILNLAHIGTNPVTLTLPANANFYSPSNSNTVGTDGIVSPTLILNGNSTVQIMKGELDNWQVLYNSKVSGFGSAAQKDSTDFYRQYGMATLASIRKNGWYIISSSDPDNPVGGTGTIGLGATVFACFETPNYGWEMLAADGHNTITGQDFDAYYRQLSGGVWSAWVRQWNSGNFNPTSLNLQNVTTYGSATTNTITAGSFVTGNNVTANYFKTTAVTENANVTRFFGGYGIDGVVRPISVANAKSSLGITPQLQADWAQTNPTSLDFIKNKFVIPNQALTGLQLPIITTSNDVVLNYNNYYLVHPEGTGTETLPAARPGQTFEISNTGGQAITITVQNGGTIGNSASITMPGGSSYKFFGSDLGNNYYYK